VSIFPILLDAAPSYLDGETSARSLLLTPMGPARLICRLHEKFCSLGCYDLAVVPTFRPNADYHRRIHDACQQVNRIITTDKIAEFAATLEPSDWLLFVDPQYLMLDGIDPEMLVQPSRQSLRGAVHLIALESNVGGTYEWVDVDASGHVARIQRFYDDVTWSYSAGVLASLVPVSVILTCRGLPFDSLRDLRTALVARGVPARDVRATGRAFDLTQEDELLSMTDSVVRAAHEQPNGSIAPGATVHASARLLGPVIVQDRAIIDRNATLIGPTIIGAGATIGANALVVQCVVQPDTEVPEHAVVRQRRVVEKPRVDSHTRPARQYDPGHARTFRSGARDKPVRPRLYQRIKRTVDASVALLALIICLPLLLLVALIIKIESRGAIFFADLRESKGGKHFKCLKFRTMVRDADTMQRGLLKKNEMDGPQFKLEKDPRVTRIGRWIRPCSVDELPQLINVARGEMSLVGPRPSPFRENQTCIPWREGRLSVRPGITGLWQVCRHDRAEGDFHQWIYYDLLYVQHMSALVDLKIIVATIVTLGGKWCVPLAWIIPESKLHKVDPDGESAR